MQKLFGYMKLEFSAKRMPFNSVISKICYNTFFLNLKYYPCYLFLAVGPKDTPMDLVLEKTYDAKTGRGMPEL